MVVKMATTDRSTAAEGRKKKIVRGMFEDAVGRLPNDFSEERVLSGDVKFKYSVLQNSAGFYVSDNRMTSVLIYDVREDNSVRYVPAREVRERFRGRESKRIMRRAFGSVSGMTGTTTA